MNFQDLDFAPLADALVEAVKGIYQSSATPVIPIERALNSVLPEEGLGEVALPALWNEITERSTRLAEPTMLGHMDTAPHPVAARGSDAGAG